MAKHNTVTISGRRDAASVGYVKIAGERLKVGEPNFDVSEEVAAAVKADRLLVAEVEAESAEDRKARLADEEAAVEAKQRAREAAKAAKAAGEDSGIPESDEPFAGYDDASVDEVIAYLEVATPEQAEDVKAYEAQNKGRVTVAEWQPETDDNDKGTEG